MKPHRNKKVIGFAVVGLLCAAIWSFGQTASPDSGLPGRVAVWHAEGSAEDSSGQGNHGIANTVRYAPGFEGKAFELDGSSACIATPVDTHPDNKPSMTWSAWVLPRKLAGNRQILTSYWDGWCRSVLIQDGQFTVYTGGGIWRTPESAGLGVWQHVAVTFSPDEIRFYKNGIESVQKHTQGPNGAVAPLYIGRNPRVQEFFGGLIDEVEIFDRALDGEEVGKLFDKYSKQAGSIAPESVADADEPEAPTGIPQAELIPITGPADPEPVAATPTPETTPEPALATPAPVVEQFAAVPAAPPSRENTTYVPSGAESPTVIAAIQTNNPEALATAVVNERWSQNIAADLTRPAPKLVGKLGRLKGKAAFVAFCPYSKDFFVGDTAAKQKSVGYFDPVIELANGPEVKAGKLEVVIVAPDPAKEIQELINQRTPKGQTPPKITIVEDPDDELRYVMGLYSTPYLLFDKDGELVWSVRAGQRAEATGLGAADLETAVQQVAYNRHIKRAKPSPLRPPERSEQPLFTFEEGTAGWTFLGDWHGQSSDADFPGLMKGFEGRRFLSSFPPNGSAPMGIAVSPAFKVTKRYLHFKIGGGDLAFKTGVALVCDGGTKLVATGKDTFELNTVTWDLADLAGKSVRLIAYDAGKSEQRDGVMLDAVFASDSPIPPASFADHHDPNKQEHAARLAAEVPADYKAFQEGNFHCEVEVGPTYLLEYNGTFTVPKGEVVRIANAPFPDTPTQTVHNQGAEIRWGKEGMSKGTLLEKPTGSFSPKNIMIDCRDRKLEAGMQGTFRYHAEITPKNLIFKQGPLPSYTPLSESEKEMIKKTRPGAFLPTFREAVRNEGLDRWPEERDSAYLLRTCRWMERYWTGRFPWSGWPFRKTDPHIEWTRKAMDCPAVGAIADCLSANGIPALPGQGMWLDAAGKNTVDHVRALVFLENVGWILIDDAKQVMSGTGQFAFGRESVGAYAMWVWDPAHQEFHWSATVNPEGKWTSKIIKP